MHREGSAEHVEAPGHAGLCLPLGRADLTEKAEQGAWRPQVAQALSPPEKRRLDCEAGQKLSHSSEPIPAVSPH